MERTQNKIFQKAKLLKEFYEAYQLKLDELEKWLDHVEHGLATNDHGEDIQSVENLINKHNELLTGIETKRTLVEDTVKKSKKLKFTSSENENFNDQLAQSENILQRFEGLREPCQIRSENLNDKKLSEIRAARLAESLLSQVYYAEASEAEQWMRELLPLVANQDAGFNQSSAEAHLRRLVSLEQEIDNFADQIKKLNKMCQEMTSAQHFDSHQLTNRQVKLEELFETLVRESSRRRAQLIDASRYYAFVRQVDDLIHLTENENYGSDLEDCIQLTEQFEQIMRELSSAGDRVAAVMKFQEELLRSNHPNAGSIRAKASDLSHLWREVNEAANDRQQALMDGKTFTTLTPKLTKYLTSVDVAVVKGFIQKHDDFLHALYVMEKQSTEICKEADRIIQLFPRTQEHIEVRRSELIEQLKDVQDGGRKFSERLAQAQNNQAYFQNYRDLMAWIYQMYVCITGEALPRNVVGCEELSVRHGEYRIEIKSHEPQKDAFVLSGRKMIQSGNALSQEIGKKIEDLELGFTQLYEVWHRRQQVYEENEDVQKWLYNAEFLENWLAEREQYLTEDWYTVESVENVEDLIRHFDDFLATLNAQSPHFEALKRLTKLEQSYAKMRSEERVVENGIDGGMALRRRESGLGGASSIGAAVEPNRRDTQQIKTLEKKKILQEKRQERERRKTQEISLMKRTPSQENADFLASTTLPRVRNRASSTSLQQEQIQSTAQPPSATSSRPISQVIDTPLTSERQMIKRVPSGKIPGFTTRRAQSIKKMRQWDDLKSIDMHGYIDRKQELQGGGKKATFRSWKNYYAILCGQLLCFFKDEESFMDNVAAAPPVYIRNAMCGIYPDYVKKKHTFKLNSSDGAEYLFSAENNFKMIEWVEKINFHAQLAPPNQLTSFQQGSNEGLPMYSPPSNPSNELMRSHTLELHTSSSNRNSIYLGDDDPRKSSTLDPRRPTSAEMKDLLSEFSARIPNNFITMSMNTDSLKSKKRSGFNLFKRSSKTAQKDVSK
uniref:PH domain-containing protein n=1 Tax=Ditylenchus dipsaci TaxID=166011 RepID=A0A915ENZ4_9BILA